MSYSYKNQKNDEFFVTQTLIPQKSSVDKIIKFLVKETNTNKFNYDQLRYIFRSVREKCNVEVPRQSQKLIELPTRDELHLFYKVIKNPIHSLIFKTLEGTGLRVSELCSLEVNRVDFANSTIFVNEGKGGKDRITLIGSGLIEKLLIYLQGRNNRYLFESNRSTMYSPRRIEQLCQHYKEEANIGKDLTPHTFRHIWNTRMAEAGISEEKRAILAGHSKNSDVQKIYTHLSLNGFKDEVLRMLDD